MYFVVSIIINNEKSIIIIDLGFFMVYEQSDVTEL